MYWVKLPLIHVSLFTFFRECILKVLYFTVYVDGNQNASNCIVQQNIEEVTIDGFNILHTHFLTPTSQFPFA